MSLEIVFWISTKRLEFLNIVDWVLCRLRLLNGFLIASTFTLVTPL
jgi:hypothetical protein